MKIPEETVRQVIEANDIVDVITNYVPDIKRAGTTFKACCPFHMEKTPSFNVNPQRQYYKCFGCGEGGDVLTFVRKQENLSFVDAVKKLAARVNIPIIEQAETREQAAARKSRSRLKELHNDFAKFMHRRLMRDPKAQHARDYLKGRGFGSEMAKNWMVGYHPERPDQVVAWAKEKGYKAQELVAAGIGVVSERNPRSGLYYRFRDRLMFPIHNDYGDVVAFSGRQLKHDPRSGKYINSPETLIFKKSKVFFGLDKARQNIPKKDYGYALLCEGQIDVIACHERGFPVAIATQGTACTPEHAQILKRYTKQVLICFDSDAAGQKATEKAFIECARVGLTVKVVVLPEGEDPDSLMQSQGAEAFQGLLDDAKDFFDYKVRYESTVRNLDNPSEKAELARDMSGLLAAMTDNFQLQAALSFLATRLGMSEDDLRNASRRQKSRERRPTQLAADTAGEMSPVEPLKMPDSLAALCHMSMNSPEAFDWMQEQIEPLIQATDGMQGARGLHTLLQHQPRPESASDITSFVGSLSAELNATLTPLYSHINPSRRVAVVSDPLQQVQQIFHRLSIDALERKRKSMTTQLSRTDLSADQLVLLQGELLQVNTLLKEARRGQREGE